MTHLKNKYLGWLISGVVLFVACSTSPLGRKQLILVPENQMHQMGVQAFHELKQKEPISHDSKIQAYVNCIVSPLLKTLAQEKGEKPWEVVVFSKDEANAFALPGRKIGVYAGLLKVAKTDAQLAAVLGHEIGHVIAHHGAERVSQQAGTQLGLQALGMITPDNSKKRMLMGLLGVGVQVGVLLPFSRAQESEADLIGLDLMARSGFDPSASVELWKNMMAVSQGAPSEWLSTHPASENRIKELQKHLQPALAQYEAVSERKRSFCKRK